MNHLSFLSFSPTFFFSASLSFHGQGRKFPVGLAEPRSPGGAVRGVMDGVLITASSTLERPRGGEEPQQIHPRTTCPCSWAKWSRWRPPRPPPQPSAPHFLGLTLIAAPSLQPNAPQLQRKTTPVEKPTKTVALESINKALNKRDCYRWALNKGNPRIPSSLI